MLFRVLLGSDVFFSHHCRASRVKMGMAGNQSTLSLELKAAAARKFTSHSCSKFPHWDGQKSSLKIRTLRYGHFECHYTLPYGCCINSKGAVFISSYGRKLKGTIRALFAGHLHPARASKSRIETEMRISHWTPSKYYVCSRCRWEQKRERFHEYISHKFHCHPCAIYFQCALDTLCSIGLRMLN